MYIKANQFKSNDNEKEFTRLVGRPDDSNDYFESSKL